jgi:hypothetical protein
MPDAGTAGERHPERSGTLRAMLLAVIVLVLVQAGLGMAVNLYVTVPARHPGARPASYFAGSYDSVTWAIGHAALVLALHASLGLALLIVAIGAAVRAFRSSQRAVAIWSLLGALLVTGAGFNGASFLDFSYNISSLLMALSAFAAAACYAVALFAARGPR